jgi:hypothetical protein
MPFLLLAACSISSGCGKGSTPAATPYTYTTSFSARNWAFHLRPVGTVGAAARASAEDTWRDLFPRMAKDQDTLQLLRRLHGGLPVEFVVVDPKAAADDEAMKAPPRERFAFVMRVGDLRTYTKTTPAGEIIFRVIAYSRVAHIKDASRSPPMDVEGALGKVVDALKEEPRPGEALGLAMDDYMLRQAPDWAIGGPIVMEDQELPGAGERRADLDRRIQAYAEHASAYYGALRKPR